MAEGHLNPIELSYADSPPEMFNAPLRKMLWVTAVYGVLRGLRDAFSFDGCFEATFPGWNPDPSFRWDFQFEHLWAYFYTILAFAASVSILLAAVLALYRPKLGREIAVITAFVLLSTLSANDLVYLASSIGTAIGHFSYVGWGRTKLGIPGIVIIAAENLATDCFPLLFLVYLLRIVQRGFFRHRPETLVWFCAVAVFFSAGGDLVGITPILNNFWQNLSYKFPSTSPTLALWDSRVSASHGVLQIVSELALVTGAFLAAIRLAIGRRVLVGAAWTLIVVEIVYDLYCIVLVGLNYVGVITFRFAISGKMTLSDAFGWVVGFLGSVAGRTFFPAAIIVLFGMPFVRQLYVTRRRN